MVPILRGRSGQTSLTLGSGVLLASALSDIARLADPALSAVIVPMAGDAGRWLEELADAVVAGRLVIPRTTLASVTLDDFTAWGRSALVDTPAAVAGTLMDDMVGIVAQVMEAARAGQVMVRVFTEAPTRRCGFHVDTVPPDAPTLGAVRVYNGPTTEYVSCDDVRSMADFYAYLARRERLSREAAVRGRMPAAAQAPLAELVAMDQAPSFLRPGAAVHQVPPDATVYFRHIDVRRHGAAHPVTDAWIHRSPMQGPPRLVLNVSPTVRARLAPGRK